MMIGIPATVKPGDWKASRFDRLPSWKIQTRAPKLAVAERSVMRTALSGITNDPKSRKRITAVASIVQPTANGRRSAWPARKSEPSAAVPPSDVRVMGASTGRARTRGTSEVASGREATYGLIAVSYTHLRAHETRHDLVCR